MTTRETCRRTPTAARTPPSAGRARAVPNKPRPENPHRMVRVEDKLWAEAEAACAKLGTTRAEVMRDALRRAVRKVAKQS